MSLKLMDDVFRMRVGNAVRKLVLIKLADNASDSGVCCPSYQHLSDQCEMSKKSVMRHILALERAGFMTKLNSHDNDCFEINNTYRLHLDNSHYLSNNSSEEVYQL